MSKGFEDAEILTRKVQESLDEFAHSHWVFTQKEWEEKVKSIRNNTLDVFRAKINGCLVDDCQGIGDFVVTDTAIDTIIYEMKGVK